MLAARACSAARVALLSETGFGKTTFLEALRREWEAAGVVVAMYQPGAALPGDVEVLLVDDADRLDDATLRGLGAPFAVFAGRPDFGNRARAMGAALATLKPFTAEDIAAYLPRRLLEIRTRVNRSSEDMPGALARASGGAPRLINSLIGSAALQAGMAGDEVITAEHVDAAAAILRPVRKVPGPAAPVPRTAPAGRWAMRAVLLVPAIAIGLLWLREAPSTDASVVRAPSMSGRVPSLPDQVTEQAGLPGVGASLSDQAAGQGLPAPPTGPEIPERLVMAPAPTMRPTEALPPMADLRTGDVVFPNVTEQPLPAGQPGSIEMLPAVAPNPRAEPWLLPPAPTGLEAPPAILQQAEPAPPVVPSSPRIALPDTVRTSQIGRAHV